MLFRAAKILISCDSDIHIKDNLKDINITSSSSLADNSQSQQLLEFDQAASDSPVTSHNASYGDDVRELTEYWYLHKKVRCYGTHHQYRLQNFEGCIQLHIDTPDTPNWYLKHHQGLEYLNMAMAQVTNNLAIADGSSIHQQAKQQLHSYLRTNIQPLMQTGKPLDLKDILHHVNIRKPKLVQQIGTQQVQNILQQVIDFSQ